MDRHRLGEDGGDGERGQRGRGCRFTDFPSHTIVYLCDVADGAPSLLLRCTHVPSSPMLSSSATHHHHHHHWAQHYNLFPSPKQVHSMPFRPQGFAPPTKDASPVDPGLCKDSSDRWEGALSVGGRCGCGPRAVQGLKQQVGGRTSVGRYGLLMGGGNGGERGSAYE